MNSSIYSIPAGQEPVWAEGVANFGWVYVNNPTDPLPAKGQLPARNVIECAPGTEAPSNCLVIVAQGHKKGGQWNPKALKQGFAEHIYLMECTWEETHPELGKIIRRGKMNKKPPNAVVIETDLVPHHWAGDVDLQPLQNPE